MPEPSPRAASDHDAPKGTASQRLRLLQCCGKTRSKEQRICPSSGLDRERPGDVARLRVTAFAADGISAGRACLRTAICGSAYRLPSHVGSKAS
jgi:hypothetical protein